LRYAHVMTKIRVRQQKRLGPHFTFFMWNVCVSILSLFSIQTIHAEASTWPNITLEQTGSTLASITPTQYEQWISYSFLLTQAKQPSSLANSQRCIATHLLCSLETSEYSAHHRSIRTILSLDKEAITAYMKSLQEETRIQPENARFELDEKNRARTFSPGLNGSEILINDNVQVLSKKIRGIIENNNNTSNKQSPPTISLTSTSIPPKITSSSAEELGINTLIGEGRSNFTGSSNDRTFNVRFGMEKFHGVLIPPGEEFSFVDILGEVNEDTGWRPELVIRNNRTEPEYGGGICQVSTTLFRAAVFSGLRITMRQNHSYPVKYYKPIGFDASVYVPMPDMRFINNTPGHILIQGEIDGTELIFRIYGTDDGREVIVEDPVVLERGEDGTMKTSFTQTVKNASGETIIDKTFFSNYDNPDNYPKPEDIDLSEKPEDWSKRQWEEYKEEIESYLKNQ